MALHVRISAFVPLLFFIATMFRYFARTYMAMLDCVAPTRNRRREAQEEILADLNACSDQLQRRLQHMEERIQQCTEKAMVHARVGRCAAPALRARELLRAKMFMHDRRRLQAEHEKALRMSHVLQTQIDSILSSHMDLMVVQTMRSYNSTASMLAMPNLTAQIEKLSDSLSDRSHELHSLQDALNTISQSMTMPLPGEDGATGQMMGSSSDDPEAQQAELMLELEELLRMDDDGDDAVVTTTSIVVSETQKRPAATIVVDAPVLIIPSPPSFRYYNNDNYKNNNETHQAENAEEE
jgi:hypothetical protein